MSDALALWSACEGTPGLPALERYTHHATRAMQIISHAHAEKMAEDIKEGGKGK